MSKGNLDLQLQALDSGLFSQIPSQTTEGDKKSLLAIQACVRQPLDGYVYLEIGSHLGGSIQPHLRDPRCKKIYSIDKRSMAQPDERGPTYGYPGNSTERMLSLLESIDSEMVKKVECIDGETKNISGARISQPPDLCFIDGEHTPTSVAADFDFCRRVCAPDATIVFHDAQIVFRGLRSVISTLKSEKSEFSAFAMRDAIYVIGLGSTVVPGKLARHVAQIRKDDLWSPRSDLRLLLWRITHLKERAFSLTKGLLTAR